MYANIPLIDNMISCRKIKKKTIFTNRFQDELLYDSSTHASIEVGGALSHVLIRYILYTRNRYWVTTAFGWDSGQGGCRKQRRSAKGFQR